MLLDLLKQADSSRARCEEILKDPINLKVIPFKFYFIFIFNLLSSVFKFTS